MPRVHQAIQAFRPRRWRIKNSRYQNTRARDRTTARDKAGARIRAKTPAKAKEAAQPTEANLSNSGNLCPSRQYWRALGAIHQGRDRLDAFPVDLYRRKPVENNWAGMKFVRPEPEGPSPQETSQRLCLLIPLTASPITVSESACACLITDTFWRKNLS